MATGVTVYKSTDGSAPVLTGTVGDLVNLLDKCLVAGYGAKAAAGWTKPFTGTNTAAFRMGGGNQLYLNVDDNGPGAGGAKEARLRGYETMSAVATGTGLFPTAAQLTAGIISRKSNTADGTARAWVVVADDRTVYVFVLTGDVANVYSAFMFGDFFSFMSGDGYRTMIAGRTTENSATVSTSTEHLATVTTSGNTTTGHYIARTYTQFGTSIAAGKMGTSTDTGFSGSLTFPNPTDGGLYASPLYINEGLTNRRGRMRGLEQPQHLGTAFGDGDTATQSGRSFLIVKGAASTSAAYVVETSDTWETNS